MTDNLNLLKQAQGEGTVKQSDLHHGNRPSHGYVHRWIRNKPIQQGGASEKNVEMVEKKCLRASISLNTVPLTSNLNSRASHMHVTI